MTIPVAKYGAVTEGRFHWIFRVADNEKILHFDKTAPTWRICDWLNHLEQRRGLHTPENLGITLAFSAKLRLNRIKKICRVLKHGEKENNSLTRERFFLFVDSDETEEKRELGGLVKEGISYGD